MVGAVIVYENKIIGEGYHQQFGGPHAEVNAINSVQNKSLLSKSTIYVSLEPCSHFGKTPPCADLIITHRIPKVVIAAIDSNAVVCGNGISKLKAAGIEVVTGILEIEANQLNRAFNTFHQKKRPFIILKWAETTDGFIDAIRTDASTPALKVSSNASSRWVHQLRSQTDAILVGKTTALLDNPSLSTRKVAGKNPIRIVIDLRLELPRSLNLFDQKIPTLVFNTVKSNKIENLEFIKVESGINLLPKLLTQLWERQIQSLLVEGGAVTLQNFIDQKLWDTIYTIKSPLILKKGINAPIPPPQPYTTFNMSTDKINCYE